MQFKKQGDKLNGKQNVLKLKWLNHTSSKSFFKLLYVWIIHGTTKQPVMVTQTRYVQLSTQKSN